MLVQDQEIIDIIKPWYCTNNRHLLLCAVLWETNPFLNCTAVWYVNFSYEQPLMQALKHPIQYFAFSRKLSFTDGKVKSYNDRDLTSWSYTNYDYWFSLVGYLTVRYEHNTNVNVIFLSGVGLQLWFTTCAIWLHVVSRESVCVYVCVH